MTRIAVIGDVHGHAAELKKLLKKIEAHQVDRVIFLGDLVDRGPASEECLRIARTWMFKARCGQYRHFEVVKGNHEDAHAREWLGLPKPGYSTTCRSSDPHLTARLSIEELEWLDQLPRYRSIPEMGLLLVHGGIHPSMRAPADLDVRVLRCRYLSEKGEMLPAFSTSPRFWADEYDGRFGFVVFGHESFGRPRFFRHALGLDGESFRSIYCAIFTDESKGVRVSKTLVEPYETPANVGAWSQGALFAGLCWG